MEKGKLTMTLVVSLSTIVGKKLHSIVVCDMLWVSLGELWMISRDTRKARRGTHP
jgi:hypothetical protein